MKSIRYFTRNALQNSEQVKSFKAFNDKIRQSASDSDFQVVARAPKNADDAAELLIMGDIGESFWGEGITGNDVTRFLADHRGRKVLVKMNSGGGDVYDGMTIMNALLQHDAEVEAEITGLCFSAASYAVLGCDVVRAHETSNFGIHPAWSFTVGNQYAHADSIRWLDSIDNMIMNVYQKRTGMDAKLVKDLFLGEDNDGTIMTATEALEYGFLDEVIALPDRATKADDDEEPESTEDTETGVENSKEAPRSERVSPEEDLEAVRRVRLKAAAFARRQKIRQREQELAESLKVN